MLKEQSAAIVLSKRKRSLVQLGAVCLTISIACYGLALSTLITPILERVGAMGYVSLLSVVSSLGITIMTPVGGKLGDIFGRKQVVVISGVACILFGIGVAYAPNLFVLMACRFGLSIAQGAFMAAPYIIVGLIHEKKDVPKAMGYLAMALSVGGFVGSIIAGALSDMGFLEAAVIFPAIPLLIGILLIGFLYPNDKTDVPVKIDKIGILFLVIALSGIFLPLSYGSSMGWGNPWILGGLVLGILFTFLLYRYEAKAEAPVIPVHTLKNRNYLAFVIVGFFCFFYRSAMDVYTPIAALNVMGTSLTMAGSMQFPKAVITMILPAIAGAWVGKRQGNMWKAMAFASLFAAVSMIVMGFTTVNTPVLLYFLLFAITGIAESFRGVSVTPAAQGCLAKEEIGVGTAMVNFVNSLSSSFAVAIYGVVYNGFTASDPTYIKNIQNGCNAVFLTAGGVSVLGLLFVIFFVRPLLEKQPQ